MRIPNAEHAIIAPEKLRDYLLNPEHRRGASKARFLLSLGYARDRWQRLESDLRQQHLPQEVARVVQAEYGTRYEIHDPLITPGRRIVMVRSIWQIDSGTNVPRLITMYPD